MSFMMSLDDQVVKCAIKLVLSCNNSPVTHKLCSLWQLYGEYQSVFKIM